MYLKPLFLIPTGITKQTIVLLHEEWMDFRNCYISLPLLAKENNLNDICLLFLLIGLFNYENSDDTLEISKALIFFFTSSFQVYGLSWLVIVAVMIILKV